MDVSKKCPVCGIVYLYPIDNKRVPGGGEHRERHNAFIKKCQIISRFASTKKNCTAFAKLASRQMIEETTGLAFIKVPPELMPDIIPPISPASVDDSEHPEMIFLNRNMLKKPPLKVFAEESPEECKALETLWKLGFMTRYSIRTSVTYRFTASGFAALAGCIERDIICQPDNSKEGLFQME